MDRGACGELQSMGITESDTTEPACTRKSFFWPNSNCYKEFPMLTPQREPLRDKFGFISGNSLATSCEELTHWKRLWWWEGLGARGEGDDRGWDGWMASLTQWTWVWVNSGSWWWTGRPGVLQFMRSQRVGHDWATDLIWSGNSVVKTSPSNAGGAGLIPDQGTGISHASWPKNKT